MQEENDKNAIDLKPKSDPVCSRCGLRSYDSECANCGTPIISKNEEDEEEYNWREHKR